MSGELVLAIDGGGTKTSVVVAQVDGKKTKVLFRETFGPCNLSNTESNDVFCFLDNVIETCLSQLPDRKPLGVAIIALAGLASEDWHNAIENWATTNQVTECLYTFSDIELIHCLGSSMLPVDNAIIALISGTGAIALGNHDHSEDPERLKRAGGWGSLVGDDGSGFWIGREALRAVCADAEGGSKTALTKMLLNSKHVDNARELVQTFYDSKYRTREIASLVPAVTQAAEDGDPIAVKILEQAGIHLANLVLSVVKQIDSLKNYSLALSGSVICQIEPVANSFKEKLALESALPQEVVFVDDPSLATIEFAKAVLSIR